MTLTPTIPIRGQVILPGMLRAIVVGRPASIAAVEHHASHGGPIALLHQLDPDIEDPHHAEMAPVATLGRILRMGRMPDGTLRVLVEALERVLVLGAIEEVDGMLAVPIDAPTAIEEAPADTVQLRAAGQQLHASFSEYLVGSGIPADDHPLLGEGGDDPLRLADQVVSTLDLPNSDRLRMLEAIDPQQRMHVALDLVAVALAQQKIASEVNAQVTAAMDASQREYHLREQLKAIRAQLGETVGVDADAELFAKRIEESGMPDEAREEALREVERLRRVQMESAEYTVIRTWLETVCDLPWSVATGDTSDLKRAHQVLDRDHHGLEKVKERLLEYLAVRQLAPESRGPILCLVGPPGVGKTSLGRSIADALGRKYERVALGGIKDETEIRGHRRTYVGALPGRIVRAMARAGSRNPVLVLDEIDKVGNDFRGDPASALLEVLDPEQNKAFVDHYLDIAVDLSQVLFVATANLVDPIPHALYDRLEILEIPGYTEEDKVQIARRFLLPKLSKDHGVTRSQLAVTEGGLTGIIRDYTREAGLRELERQLAALHRKVARGIVEGRAEKVRVTRKNLSTFLGPIKYHQELVERVDQPGVVIGLAWTATGGDILFVEATRMPGKYGLKLTGSLGDVMKESVEAAMSWLRSNGQKYGVDTTIFESEFHLHVPAGAIPKDGPSAGVTMVTALASLVTGRPVRPRLAMTGEITLRGRVLPVGGVKEKALAARRAGVETLILPSRNASDLIDIPEALRSGLDFRFVETVHEVLEQALQAPG